MFVQTVALKEIKFYAYHGFYAQEQLTGNHFSVDVEVTFVPSGDTEEIGNTVNYEIINAIVAKEMQRTQKMLETVIKNIIDALLMEYSFLLTANVTIRKIAPSMPGEVGYSLVSLNYTAG